MLAGDTFAALRGAITDLNIAVEARADAEAKALELNILDHYVETAEAALPVPPPMP